MISQTGQRLWNYRAVLCLYSYSSFVAFLFDTIIFCHDFFKFPNPKNDQKLSWTKEIILFSGSFCPSQESLSVKCLWETIHLFLFIYEYFQDMISPGGGISLGGVIALLVADRDGKVWNPNKQNCSILPLLCAFLHLVVTLLGQRFTLWVIFCHKMGPCLNLSVWTDCNAHDNV